jgi:tRNA(Ile2) C34 agmatinyltransferase TiaS
MLIMWSSQKKRLGPIRCKRCNYQGAAQELTATHREFYDGLYEATAELRRRAVRDSEARRLRRSV